MRGNLKRRLRDDVSGAFMLPETLRLILDTHKRFPSQSLYMFRWRRGPDDRWTIYDMDLPRRTGMTEDTCKGWAESDWWAHATVTNVPTSYMNRWDRAVKVKQTIADHDGNLKTKEVDEVHPGYKIILTRLLIVGCIVPSRAIDAWLGDDSRKYVPSWNRLTYRGDL